MSDERKGFLTPEQEKKIDDLIELSGVAETFDGVAIKLADNYGLEALKSKIPEDILPIVYEVIDQILDVIPDAE
jgi:hypothetical protein